MAKTASMYIRIDPQVKADVERIYAKYGMSLTDAINVFLYQSRNVGGLPFDLRPSEYNDEILAAMEETKKIIESWKGRFDNLDERFQELGL